MLKDKSYYSLSPQDRLLALFGVPINYIKKPITVEKFNFLPTSIAYAVNNVTVIQSEYQYNFLVDLLENIDCIGEPSTYVIGSYPTDQAAYQLATLLTKTYQEHLAEYRIFPRIKWIDLGCPDWEFLKSDERCCLLIVHGLSENSSENRKLEVAKDFFRRVTHATRIMLAVTPNILNYAITKLEVAPDGAFQLTKTTNRVVV